MEEMDNLEKLEHELYEKKSDTLAKRLRERILFPRTLQKVATAWGSETPEKKTIVPRLNKQIFKYLLGGVLLLFIILGAAFVFFYLGTQGQEVALTIHKKESLETGEVITIPITYKNTSNSTLTDAELTIFLPEGTLLREGDFDRPAPTRLNKKIENLAPREEGVTEVSVRFFGYEGEEKEVEATLLYKPEALRARFSARTSEQFVVTRVPLALVMELPQGVAQGQEVEARLRFSSTASRSFDNLWLKTEYPSGFSFLSSSPNPGFGSNIWSIGTLEAGQEGTITFKGTLSGPERESKPFRAELGIFNPITKEWKTYREVSEVTSVAVTPLAVEMFLDGTREKTVIPGDQLNFTARYRNNTQATLRNVTLKAVLSGDVLDFSSLSVDQGAFNFSSQSIIWNTASAEELREVKSGQEGEFNFSIRTKDRPVMRTVSDKNQTIRVRIDIVPAFTPEELAGVKLASGDALEFKVKTKVLFSGKSLHRSSPLVNSGPLPPEVGKKTIYTLVWEVRNFTNDLGNAEIRASLPPNISWESNSLPRDANIIFDEISQEVRWTIGRVEAGTGILSPSMSVAFQVGVVPSQADRGKAITLLNPSKLTGKDLFTNEAVEAGVAALSTELREDSGVSSNDWAVAP